MGGHLRRRRHSPEFGCGTGTGTRNAALTPHKPAAGFWITVALVAVLVAYPLSWGPACWGWERGWVNDEPLAIVYLPIERSFWNFPKPVRRAMIWWAILDVLRGDVPNLFFFVLLVLIPVSDKLIRRGTAFHFRRPRSHSAAIKRVTTRGACLRPDSDFRTTIWKTILHESRSVVARRKSAATADRNIGVICNWTSLNRCPVVRSGPALRRWEW
jgi:hypothetical protein